MPILLFVLFIVVPIVELAVLLQVGDWLGWLPTVGLLIVVSVLGTWLVRREGTRAWRAFRAALAQGRVPTTQAVDGMLVLFGGALLLTPGFVTDLLGLALLIPPSRAVLRRVVTAQVAKRALGRTRGRGARVDVIDVTPTSPRRGRSRSS